MKLEATCEAETQSGTTFALARRLVNTYHAEIRSKIQLAIGDNPNCTACPRLRAGMGSNASGSFTIDGIICVTLWLMTGQSVCLTARM